jgi:hypothetical protein
MLKRTTTTQVQPVDRIISDYRRRSRRRRIRCTFRRKLQQAFGGGKLAYGNGPPTNPDVFVLAIALADEDSGLQ